jgi:hypothetical protein
MSTLVKEYDTKIDDKKRITIRRSKFTYYKVKEYDDGHLELEPRVLVSPEELSENTLKMMDKSVENLKNGDFSEPINFSK